MPSLSQSITGSIPAFSGLLSDAFNNMFGSGGVVDTDGVPRNAMIFTSVLRSQGLYAGRDLVGRAEAQIRETVEAARSARSGAGFMPYIALALNPKNIKAAQPKRIVVKPKMRGSTIYHYTDHKGRNNDLMTLQMRGSSGNIDRGSWIDPAFQAGDSPTDPNGVQAKILTWNNLYQLSREPAILPDGTRNDVTISVVSNIMPIVIDYIGYFNAVLEYEIVSEKPFSVDYSMEFTVLRTIPDMDEITHEIANTLAMIRATPAPDAAIFGTVLATDVIASL